MQKEGIASKLTKIPKKYSVFFICFVVITIIGEVLLGFHLVSPRETFRLLVLVVVSLVVLFMEIVSFVYFIMMERDTPWGVTSLKLLFKVLLFSALAGVVFEILTIFGDPLNSLLVISNCNIKRIIIVFIIAFVFLLVYLSTSKKGFLFWVKSRVNIIQKHKIVTVLIQLFVVGLVAILSGWILLNSFGYSFFVSSLFVFCLACICVSFYHNIKMLGTSPEYLFLPIALATGLFIAVVLPPTGIVSWDDETHYKRSLALSYIVDSTYSDADRVITEPLEDDSNIERIEVGIHWGENGATWTEGEVKEYDTSLNRLENDSEYYSVNGFGTAPPSTSIISYSTIGYIPAAFGLWLGRLLHLPFSVIFVLGKVFNLISYCCVSFLAIRITPIKKTLLAVIALIPTNIYLAANYSYDSWLTSFLFLAVAYTLKEICTPNLKLTPRTTGRMIILYVIALGPKAIYFPLLGILFLMPKSKFIDDNSRRLYYATVVGAVLFAICATAISFLIPGAGASTTDSRGGIDVNSSLQIQYVLSDPLRYLSILSEFLFNGYLSIPQSPECTVNYAYLGILAGNYSALSSFIIVFILLVAILDADSVSCALARLRINVWSVFLFLVSIGLVASSMYVAFTPVGFGTINGCQPRYLLALLFPLFALGFNTPIVNTINYRVFSTSSILIMGILNAICVWSLIGSKVFA